MSAKYKLIVIIFPLLFLTSCNKFDQDVWLQHNDYNEYSNPRSKMIGDLRKNYLIHGKSKNEVVQLLGPPASDYRIKALPSGMTFPDSIIQMSKYFKGKTIEEMNKAGRMRNKYINLNGDSVNQIYYPIGWSLIDPRSLIIQFNIQGNLDTIMTRQH